MRRYLPFLVPIALASVAVGPIGFWMSRDGRPLFSEPSYQLVPLDEAHPLEAEFVEVSGMSHYPVVVRQEIPGNLFRSARTVFLFPLMQPHDVDGRLVRLVVRTERQPAKLVSYEFMRVRGKVKIATARQVPFGTEEMLGRKGYYFADELLVIEADHVEPAEIPVSP